MRGRSAIKKKGIDPIFVAAVLAISLAMAAPAAVFVIQVIVLGGAALLILSRLAPADGSALVAVRERLL